MYLLFIAIVLAICVFLFTYKFLHHKGPSLRVESEEEYRKIRDIMKSYIIFLPKYNQQLALALTWEKELYRAKLADAAHRPQSIKELEIGLEFNEKVTKSLLDNFWDKQGGYNKRYDPKLIPLKAWPRDLRNEFLAKVPKKDVREINQLAQRVKRLKAEVASKANNRRSTILPEIHKK